MADKDRIQKIIIVFSFRSKCREFYKLNIIQILRVMMLDPRVYVCLSLILRISFVGLNREILKILMIEGGT